jgi:hypothetical protein
VERVPLEFPRIESHPGLAMRADLDSLSRMSVSQYVAYLVVVGALAGVVAWCLVALGHLVFDISRPTSLALLLAIPRGSLFALIVGFGVRLWLRVRGNQAGKRRQS